MTEDRDERLWWVRLRWKLRGAWQAPSFVVLTLVEAVLLNRLPISGDNGYDLIGGFLLCGFFNLIVIGLFAPLGARLLRRRRPSSVPLSVAQDRLGTGLMAALGVLLVAVGIGHHAAVTAAQREYDSQLQAVRTYVFHQAPHEFRRGVGFESVWKQKSGFYRTCVPGPDPQRSLCLFVETDGIATVTPDPDMQSNARIAGADNPGRSGP